MINPVGLEVVNFDFAEKVIYVDDNVASIKEIAKALLDMGKEGKADDFEEFKASLAGVVVSEDMKEVAEVYAGAKKAMIVFQQNVLSVGAATMIADIALLSGHIGSPRDGIVMLKAKNNSQGLVDLGIKKGAEVMDGVKALLCFGEDPQVDLSELEFLMVVDTHMTDTCKKADVVIGGSGLGQGTFTNTTRLVQNVRCAVDEGVALNNAQIAKEIAKVYEVSLDENVVVKERGGVLDVVSPAFVAVGDDKFVNIHECTDNLMNVTNDRLPKQVKNPNKISEQEVAYNA